MPLVWELTNELKNWLTPAKLRSLNQGWLAQGGGRDRRVIEDFNNILVRNDMHYEQLLGYLEVQYQRRHLSEEYHGIYAWLVELVYTLLYLRHINNVDLIKDNINLLKGLDHLAQQNTPLWIFSLNHDLIIECFAVKYGIPLSSGFTTEKFEMPRWDKDRNLIGTLSSDVLPGRMIGQQPLPYLERGEYGINLLKIHGSLDVFTFRDGQDLLKLKPVDNSVDGVIESLRLANEELKHWDSRWPGGFFNATNEIAYADFDHIAQFLRRTLLAGAFKFDDRHDQVLPTRMLGVLTGNLLQLSRLISIGYSFGDDHINRAVREWLEIDRHKKLIIVDPYAESLPTSLQHLAPQIKVVAMRATEYLDWQGQIERSSAELSRLNLARWLRGSTDKNEAIERIRKFTSKRFDRESERLINDLAGLPIRDGTIDLQALNMTSEEFVQTFAKRINYPSFEQLVDEFLKTQSVI